MKRFIANQLEKWVKNPFRKPLVTEQFVQQELWAVAGVDPFTWAPSDSKAEVAFLAEVADGVVPIEAKAERNLQAKSLGVYREKFAPRLALRTSLADPKREEGLWDVPLYALGPTLQRVGGNDLEEAGI